MVILHATAGRPASCRNQRRGDRRHQTTSCSSNNNNSASKPIQLVDGEPTAIKGISDGGSEKPRQPLFDETPGAIASLLAAASAASTKGKKAKLTRAISAPGGKLKARTAAARTSPAPPVETATIAQRPCNAFDDEEMSGRWQAHEVFLQAYLAETNWEVVADRTFVSISQRGASRFGLRRATSAPERVSDSFDIGRCPSTPRDMNFEPVVGCTEPLVDVAAPEVLLSPVFIYQEFGPACPSMVPLPPVVTPPANDVAVSDQLQGPKAELDVSFPTTVGGLEHKSLEERLQWLCWNAMQSNYRIHVLEQRVAHLESENSELRSALLSQASSPAGSEPILAAATVVAECSVQAEPGFVAEAAAEPMQAQTFGAVSGTSVGGTHTEVGVEEAQAPSVVASRRARKKRTAKEEMAAPCIRALFENDPGAVASALVGSNV